MQVVNPIRLGVAREVILPAVTQELSNCLVGDNFDRLPDPVLSRFRDQTYSARTVEHPSVELIRYPAGTRLFGGGHFLIESDGLLAEDQVPPRNVLADLDMIPVLAAEPLEQVAIDEPCVIVSRFGLMVWGHWIGELLPRILLVERAFPKRLRYVLPPQVFNSSAPRNVWNSIFDTIRMLGIEKSRILPTQQDRHYVFSNLYSMTSIYNDAAFHPGAVTEIRSAYLAAGNDSEKADRKVAILRTESVRRNISNLAEIIPALRRRDYEFIEIGAIPFQEQVHLFSTARIVVGVLASGLAGLLFSPERVRVVSVAQESYLNRFFYAMMQQRRALYYDVRGRITNRHPKSDVFSDFGIDKTDFETALDYIEAGVN
jgi:hypothetical protein